MLCEEYNVELSLALLLERSFSRCSANALEMLCLRPLQVLLRSLFQKSPHLPGWFCSVCFAYLHPEVTLVWLQHGVCKSRRACDPLKGWRELGGGSRLPQGPYGALEGF